LQSFVSSVHELKPNPWAIFTAQALHREHLGRDERPESEEPAASSKASGADPPAVLELPLCSRLPQDPFCNSWGLHVAVFINSEVLNALMLV
jgi:hypothetical protein